MKGFHSNSIILIFPLLLNFIFTACTKADTLTNKTIAVYGASHSICSESDSAILFWQRELGFRVFRYGISGAGYSNNYSATIPNEINNSPSHEIAILWSTTNGYPYPIENEDKFSPKSMKGGMRISIEKLKSKNPNVIILGFIMLPRFDDRNPEIRKPYMEGQIEVFEEYNIPYLNQYYFFTADDTTIMYLPDKLHLTVKGYLHIRNQQLEFIRQNIQIGDE